MEIFERNIGFNNKEMYEHCKLLQDTISITEEYKEGRGKNVKILRRFKHDIPSNVRDKINNSCEYYKKLMDNPNAIQFRDYQTKIIYEGTKILKESGFLYLAMEVRTGKDSDKSRNSIKHFNSECIVFNKKKAISSIQKDYEMLDPLYHLTITNYENLHNLPNRRFDVIICDEAHSMGAFPKPSKRAQQVKDLIVANNAKVILLSGTPTPESYSQMYHQVYGIPNNPFNEFKNFYRFCDNFVNVTTKVINGLSMNDYSKGLDTIIESMAPFTINYTQEEAGFLAKTTEEIFEVELKESTYKLINKLKRDLIIEGKEEVVLGDTPVKLMSKMHQLYSGTIKFESGKSMVIDTTKAEYIKEQFMGCQIGIFYKFKEELVALKQVFGDELTTDLDEFNSTYKNIALQIVSGREGLSLKKAEYLVYYNIDFSATSYWQSKDRMTTKDRLENQVFWIFAKGGIEHEIYKAVTKKKDYTLAHFKKDFRL